MRQYAGDRLWVDTFPCPLCGLTHNEVELKRTLDGFFRAICPQRRREFLVREDGTFEKETGR